MAGVPRPQGPPPLPRRHGSSAARNQYTLNIPRNVQHQNDNRHESLDAGNATLCMKVALNHQTQFSPWKDLIAQDLSRCSLSLACKYVPGRGLLLSLRCQPRAEPDDGWHLELTVYLMIRDFQRHYTRYRIKTQLMKHEMSHRRYIDKELVVHDIPMPQPGQPQLSEEIKVSAVVAYVIDPDYPLKSKAFNTTQNFSQEWNNSDVIFTVEGRSVHAHRQVLSVASPVFDVLFNGAFREANTKTIPLPNKQHTSFTKFLNAIYPGQTNVLGMEAADALELLPLANEYQVAALEKLTVAILHTKMTHHMALHALVLGDAYHHQEIVDRALTLALKLPAADIQNYQVYKEMPTHLRLQLMYFKNFLLEQAVADEDRGQVHTVYHRYVPM